MTKPSPTLDLLRAAKIVPVIRTPSARHAATAVQWLYDSGIRIFEITLTIPDAVSLIRDLASDRPCWSAPARSPMPPRPRPASRPAPASSSHPGSTAR
jgi:2-keto-3-deoxy-6-phosphogluconate aldolase